MKNHPYHTRSKSNSLKLTLNSSSKVVIITEEYSKKKLYSQRKKNNVYSSLNKQIEELKESLEGDFNETYREASWNESEQILLVSILYHILTFNSELDELYHKESIFPHQYINIKNQAVQLVYKLTLTEIGKKLLRQNSELREVLSLKRKRFISQLEEGEFKNNEYGRNLLSFLRMIKF